MNSVTQPSREFDLNIEKVLEGWEVKHAIRELIANAFDEQAITGTEAVKIYKDPANNWHIRDFGRGLEYRHFTQNENAEKLARTDLIGKFGVGLKDAFATFDRHNIGVELRSKHGIFRIKHAKKAGFDDIITLHAEILPPRGPGFVGTDCILTGCTDDDIAGAKEFFLQFAGLQLLEQTKSGEIYNPANATPAIYVNGIKIAEEPNFLFSYNITRTTEALRKALNRERTNVGRSAYADRVKDILLRAKSLPVCEKVVAELGEFSSGHQKDELKWVDVSVCFVKILDETGNKVFVTASEYGAASGRTREIVEDSGKEIVYLPDNVMDKLRDTDSGITDIAKVKCDYASSFEYHFVSPSNLTTREKLIYQSQEAVLRLVYPDYSGEILISEQLRTVDDDDTRGVYEASEHRIIILRDVLRRRQEFLGTLAHELIHAKSGASDCSREFETALTDCIGELLSASVK